MSRTIDSPRIRAAARAYGLARHDLLVALIAEASGRTAIVGRNAYSVVAGRLVVAPVAVVRKPKSE